MGFMDRMEKYGFVPANHEQPNFFPTELVPMQAAGRDVPGWKALVRTDTGETLHCWQDGYQLIGHGEAVKAFDAAIAESGLDTMNMMVATDLTHDGKRLFRQYVFPEHAVDVGGGDMTALRIVGFNSFDGSMAVSWRGGGYRFVCANTSVVGRDVAQVRARHVAGTDIEALAKGMVAACELFLVQTERWQQWAQVGIETEDAVRVFESLPASTDTLVGNLSLSWVNRPEHDSAPSLWSLFNVMTEWATHGESRGENRAAAVLARQERVAKTIEGRTWKLLEAA